MKAITPQEAIKGKTNTIPSVVFEVFNDLIKENLGGKSSSFQQDSVVRRLEKRGLERTEIFNKGWLDVEPAYRKAGWIVDYDKPGFNECYPATFTFSISRVSLESSLHAAA